MSSFTVIVAFVALAIAGCALVPLLPVKWVPDKGLPALTVSLSMPGASARTVESEVTAELEAILARLDNVVHIESRSSQGYAAVTLQFARGTDMAKARFAAAASVRQIWSALPPGVSYPTISQVGASSLAMKPFMSLTLSGDRPAEWLRSYAESVVKPALASVSGVGAVTIEGAVGSEWAVSPKGDPAVPDHVIASAVASSLRSGYPGRASDGSEELAVVIMADTAIDADRTLVGTVGRSPVALAAVADVGRVKSEPARYYRVNGMDALVINISAEPDANQIGLARRVASRIAELSTREDVYLSTVYDASASIASELQNIYMRTGLTVLILLAFVGLVTRSWRYLLLVTISLAVNMCISAALFYLLGVEIQLYSLAGITISLNLVIDNIIVMAEHYSRRRDAGVFGSILAATLTTVGAVATVYFLDEAQVVMLGDFVAVVVISLGVSLAVALLLVPALVERMLPGDSEGPCGYSERKTKIFSAIAVFAARRRKWVIAAFVLIFGLPVFMLPDRLDPSTFGSEVYNATIGSQFYQTNLRRPVDVALGGCLRLFVRNVHGGNIYDRDERSATVTVECILPDGTRAAEMSRMLRPVEKALAGADGVAVFTTSVTSGSRGSVTVEFTREASSTATPMAVRERLVSCVKTLGGAAWTVSGPTGATVYSNDVRRRAGVNTIELTGYNYDRLCRLVDRCVDSLASRRRVGDIDVGTAYSPYARDYAEYRMTFNYAALARDSVSVADICAAFAGDYTIGAVVGSDGAEIVKLRPRRRYADVWGALNTPLNVEGRPVRPGDYATLERVAVAPDVLKRDGAYIMTVQYEYIGESEAAAKTAARVIASLAPDMPPGYTAVDITPKGDRPDDGGGGVAGVLILIGVLIFVVSSIQFNSLRLPLAVIATIPVALSGLFFTFGYFNIKYDGGGVAAMILLSGITVNASIYVIAEYRRSRREAGLRASAPALFGQALAVKARAVSLTVVSTVLGFIPFLVGGGDSEAFWTPLAAGTMGGLLMSLTAVIILLPALLLNKKSLRG